MYSQMLSDSVGLPEPSMREQATRAYTGILRVDDSTREILAVHTRATNVAIAAITRVCVHAVAASVDSTWVNTWQVADTQSERHRIAAVCVLSWVSPVTHARDTGLPAVADPVAYVRNHLVADHDFQPP